MRGNKKRDNMQRVSFGCIQLMPCLHISRRAKAYPNPVQIRPNPKMYALVRLRICIASYKFQPETY